MLNWEGRAGAVVLAVLLLMALLAQWIAPGDPLAITGEPMLRPFASGAHILGTDRLGRDVFAGLLHGTRTTLLVACFSAAVALVIGSVVGTLAGYLGGFADTVLMRITEAFQTVPSFLLALAAISVTGPSVPTLIFAISLGTWTQAARVTRAEVLSLRERDFVCRTHTRHAPARKSPFARYSPMHSDQRHRLRPFPSPPQFSSRLHCRSSVSATLTG